MSAAGLNPACRNLTNREMSDNHTELIQKLEALPDINVDTWKDTDLLCVFYNGKEIAHFQNEHEIDIRLTPAIIKRMDLQPPENTASHTDRSKNSRWIVQSTDGRSDDIVKLIVEASKL